MISVSHLSCMRKCTVYGISVGTGTISADDVNLRMGFEPRENRISRTIRQKIEWSMSLHIDQDRSITVPTPHRKVIYSQDVYRSIRRIRDRSQVAQERGGPDFHPQLWGKTLTHLSTGGKSNGFHLRQKAITHACPGPDQVRKP